MGRVRRKIAVIGAGNVGATCAFVLAQKKLGDIVMLDIYEGFAKGKALDMSQDGQVLNYDGNIFISNGFNLVVFLYVLGPDAAHAPGLGHRAWAGQARGRPLGVWPTLAVPVTRRGALPAVLRGMLRRCPPRPLIGPRSCGVCYRVAPPGRWRI